VKEEPVVDIRGLTVDFETIDGTLRVVQGVSLTIGEGEVVGIVGETGCGKSVTAKVLLGILPTPPGRIKGGGVFLLGQNILQCSSTERELLKQKIAYIPQDPTSSLNPVFTIGTLMVDMIIWRKCGQKMSQYLWRRRNKKTIQEAENYSAELLKKLYIPDPEALLHKYGLELSGGMKQRVLLAMALSGHPKVIIADEPTTALDATTQKRTLLLIQEKIQEGGLAGLYITHNLGVARVFCHRTYVMYGGIVAETGRTLELLDSPLHPYTRGLVSSIPKLTRVEFKGIDGQIPDYLNPPPGCRFHPRCDQRKNICSEDAPPMFPAENNRLVACWLYR
jgi:oligopeptide/dipeptide ABC transporter ATP-binding protein